MKEPLIMHPKVQAFLRALWQGPLGRVFRLLAFTFLIALLVRAPGHYQKYGMNELTPQPMLALVVMNFVTPRPVV